MSYQIEPEEDGTETHLIMTEDGYRLERRRPVPVTKWDYVAAIVILFIIAAVGSCSAT